MSGTAWLPLWGAIIGAGSVLAASWLGQWATLRRGREDNAHQLQRDREAAIRMVQKEQHEHLRQLFTELLNELYGALTVITHNFIAQPGSSPDLAAVRLMFTDKEQYRNGITRALVPLLLEPAAQPILVAAQEAVFNANGFLSEYFLFVSESHNSRVWPQLPDWERVLTPMFAKLAQNMQKLLADDALQLTSAHP